jgi:hypothetical protein
MKSGGQRQDVAFLALAVAVLAVAVALFVGMKSMQKPRPAKPEPKPEKQATVAVPRVEKQTGGPRDPFKGGAPIGRGGSAGATGGPVAQSLKLVGIVVKQGEQPVAVIHSTKKRYYAKVGQRAAGHTVKSIGANQVVLEKDGASLTLLLHQPEAEEE